jgi:predicted enzyme related to lactoylglutathione lyase
VRGYADGTPCWAQLGTPDIATSEAFYRGLFGWCADADEGAFRLGGLAVAGLVAGNGPGSGPAGWLTYVATERIDALPDLVSGGGGATVRAPEPLGTKARAALFTDPSGAVFGGWQRTGLPGAQLAGEPNTVCWSDLATGDEPGATTFYGKVFGWEAQPGEMADGMDYREWLSGGRVIGGIVPLRGARIPAHWRTAVEVACLDWTIQRCRDLGGRLGFGPIDVLVGRYAELVDPHGAAFGIVELIPELRRLES